MEVEKENKHHHPKPTKKFQTKRQEWVRIFVKKEVMEIEEKPRPINKTPPKTEIMRKQAGKKHKESPEGWAPRAKRKKKTLQRRLWLVQLII